MIRGHRVSLDFHSSVVILDFVLAVTDLVGRRAGLDDEALQSVALAVRESVINAITHGNANDENKRVHVEVAPLERDDPGLAIRVRDEGAGFDPSGLADCRSSENLLKSGGRGIFLIRSFMDELVLQRAPEGGMEVFMVKRVQRAAL